MFSVLKYLCYIPVFTSVVRFSSFYTFIDLYESVEYNTIIFDSRFSLEKIVNFTIYVQIKLSLMTVFKNRLNVKELRYFYVYVVKVVFFVKRNIHITYIFPIVF